MVTSRAGELEVDQGLSTAIKVRQRRWTQWRADKECHLRTTFGDVGQSVTLNTDASGPVSSLYNRYPFVGEAHGRYAPPPSCRSCVQQPDLRRLRLEVHRRPGMCGR